MTNYLCKYPAIAYFVIAFALSWGSVWAVIAPGEIPADPEDAERLFPIVYLAMLVGPSVAGLLMTAVTAGREGLRLYRTRLTLWRVPGRWYAIALLTAPVLFLGTLVILSAYSDGYTPSILGPDTIVSGPVRGGNLPSFILLGISIGIGAGFFEELGWTGFAIPTMGARKGVLRTGAIVGLLWGAWHFLAVLWGSANAFGSLPVPIYMAVSLFAFLPPYRILMVRVYDRTGSLLISVLMHASLTTSMILFGPAVEGEAAIAYQLVFGAVLWAGVAFSGRWARNGVTHLGGRELV